MHEEHRPVIIEPAKPISLLEVPATLAPLDEEFPAGRRASSSIRSSFDGCHRSPLPTAIRYACPRTPIRYVSPELCEFLN